MTDITIPPEALREKVVAAIRDSWNNAPNDGNPISYHLADAAIAVVLEEAANLCDYYAERHIDPMNFAKECAADIRALIPSASASDS